MDINIKVGKQIIEDKQLAKAHSKLKCIAPITIGGVVASTVALASPILDELIVGGISSLSNLLIHTGGFIGGIFVPYWFVGLVSSGLSVTILIGEKKK